MGVGIHYRGRGIVLDRIHYLDLPLALSYNRTFH